MKNLFFSLILIFCVNEYAMSSIIDEDEMAEEHVAELVKSANNGDSAAQYELGMLYYESDFGIEVDLTQAKKWFEKAAAKGNGDSQYMLGVMYYSGTGVTKNEKLGISWLKKAAKNGSSDAELYLQGMEDPDDTELVQRVTAAKKEYRGKAPKGNAADQYNLGMLLTRYQENDQELIEARKWFKSAAEQGHKDAQFELAKLYAHGGGGDIDIDAANKWYMESCKNGVAIACEKY